MSDRFTQTAEEMLRLECLKQAVSANGSRDPSLVLGLAQKFAAFVDGEAPKQA